MSSRPLFSATIVISLLFASLAVTAQTERPARTADAAKALKNDPLHVFSQSVQALSAEVTKSVVQVLTAGFGLSDKNEKTDTAYLAPQRGIGAGVILSPDGYIVTNAHVVQGARKIRVRLQGLEKQAPGEAPRGPIEANLVGVDRQTDLAVLKIDMKALPALALADSNELKQGQVVFAFGSPLGLENSVTMGIVSATARQIDTDNPSIYIQTDAPINPGNSGGPLVDVDGHVVGINTFILSQSGGNEGLGFAIPSNVVRNIYEQIRTEGHVHRGQIGVFLRTITPDLVAGLHLPVSDGVLLDDVVPGSPADKAGLKVGDIVTSVGGKPVDNVRQFSLDLYSYKIGQKAEVSVLRDGKATTFSVPVVERRDDPMRFADLVSGPENLVNRLGVVAINITGELKEVLGGDLRIPNGVLVAAKTPTSSLLGEGPQPGDVIHSVNGTPIQNVTELKKSLRELKPGAPIVLQIERSGSLSYLVLDTE
ncbi:MAG: trypsin-like peptidase domain-containing protein [Acidobacteriota bacterium]|nr:trypsin-like peptidase domain-containing protein [Acidobacteriota bacterium]